MEMYEFSISCLYTYVCKYVWLSMLREDFLLRPDSDKESGANNKMVLRFCNITVRVLIVMCESLTGWLRLLSHCVYLIHFCAQIYISNRSWAIEWMWLDFRKRQSTIQQAKVENYFSQSRTLWLDVPIRVSCVCGASVFLGPFSLSISITKRENENEWMNACMYGKILDWSVYVQNCKE